MNKYQLYQIFCEGYHITENTAKWTNEDDGYPDYVEIKTTTSDVAEREGWTTTKDKKFSRTNDIVWLCPDCSERWKQEKQIKIDDIINSKQKLHNAYMDQKTSDDHRVWIIDKALPDLRRRFIDFEPTSEDWRRWYEI